jgi:hypothetical protein
MFLDVGISKKKVMLELVAIINLSYFKFPIEVSILFFSELILRTSVSLKQKFSTSLNGFFKGKKIETGSKPPVAN